MDNYIQFRNREICRIAKRILTETQEKGEKIDISQLVQRVLSTRPSAHYVSYKNAASKIAAIVKRGTLPRVRSSEQWLEIAEQVTQMMRQRQRLKFRNALTMVLAFQRPSRFYLKPDSVYRILRNTFSTTLVAN